MWGKEEEEEVAEFDIITSEERRGKGEGGAIKKPGGDFCLLFSPAGANTLFFSFSPPPIGGKAAVPKGLVEKSKLQIQQKKFFFIIFLAQNFVVLFQDVCFKKETNC